MYPNRELSQLALHKAALQRTIGRHRQAFATTVSSVVQPLRWLDRWSSHVRRVAPFVPLALVLLGAFRRRAPTPTPRWTSRILRWGRGLRFGLRALTVLAVARSAAVNRPR